ncbi:MAG: acetolactate synthase small subunit [bacterium]
MSNKQHVISLLTENHSGVAARIIGLFTARGYNIDSFSAAPTEDPKTSRILLVVEGDDRIIEQVTKQLNKLIDVIKVLDLTGSDYVERELMLIKVCADKKNRSQIIEIADLFKSSIISVTIEDIILEITGDEEKLNTVIELLKPFGIKEAIRTGKIAISRKIEKII